MIKLGLSIEDDDEPDDVEELPPLEPSSVEFMSPKRKDPEPPAPRATGKRKGNDDDAGFAGDVEGDVLEDLLGLDGGLESLDQEDGGDDDDLAAALREDVDERELAARFSSQDSQVLEAQESESEESAELPFTDEELTTAEKLNFCGVSLSGAQARRVAQLVADNSSLLTIQFEGHELPIGDLLEEDELELDSEEYTDIEAIIIAEILKKDNNAVKRLDLARNQITDDGAKALAQMLTTNATLEYLNLESNMISEKGGAAFGRAVLENSTLQYLNLMYNSIPSTRQQDLRDIWQATSGRGQLGLHL